METKAGESWISRLFVLQSEFKVSLGNLMRPCLKTAATKPKNIKPKLPKDIARQLRSMQKTPGSLVSHTAKQQWMDRAAKHRGAVRKLCVEQGVGVGHILTMGLG